MFKTLFTIIPNRKVSGEMKTFPFIFYWQYDVQRFFLRNSRVSYNIVLATRHGSLIVIKDFRINNKEF